MTKTLLTGMAVCAALAIVAGDADAHVKKTVVQTAVHAKKMTPALASASLPARWTVKGGPLHDCVHVLFPQCSRGFGEPND
jgi:hypothetical protein